MRALGFTDVMRLHGWMTEQLAGHVCSKGRVYMGYDDGVRNGAKLDSRQTVLICSNAAFGAMYAARGFKVVMAPLEYCFWDFHQNIPSDRNVYATWWAGCITLGQVFSFKPRQLVTPYLAANVIGADAYNWTEYSYSAEELEWKIWPRAIAFAQALWNPLGGYSYGESFLPALPEHVERLRAAGINSAPPGAEPVRASACGSETSN